MHAYSSEQNTIQDETVVQTNANATWGMLCSLLWYYMRKMKKTVIITRVLSFSAYQIMPIHIIK